MRIRISHSITTGGVQNAAKYLKENKLSESEFNVVSHKSRCYKGLVSERNSFRVKSERIENVE
ncbi:MAG: hypothetical protein ACI4DY_06635 [Monoglobaceae bacterium]